MAENMRPMSGEGSRIGGTANKTNSGVNNTVGMLGTAGRVAGVACVGISVLNVATAEDKSQAVATEGGDLVGAVVGGEIGAAIGVWFTEFKYSNESEFCFIDNFIFVNENYSKFKSLLEANFLFYPLVKEWEN